MNSTSSLSLIELLDLVWRDGLIDRYEAGVSEVTIYQNGETYSLGIESAKDFLGRVVRAMSLDRQPAI
ncbi:MAG TPA: hypothetical protein VFG50_14250 [Rhodothermales bacterium]|nr:hypothetical protein [Rhodothermales bacterium]